MIQLMYQSHTVLGPLHQHRAVIAQLIVCAHLLSAQFLFFVVSEQNRKVAGQKYCVSLAEWNKS